MDDNCEGSRNSLHVECYTEIMGNEAFFTYMVECADGTLYTGWTTDVEQRLARHNQGKGAKYTRARLPVRLKGFWSFQSKSEAMRFEHQLKQLPRIGKERALRESAPHVFIGGSAPENWTNNA